MEEPSLISRDPRVLYAVFDAAGKRLTIPRLSPSASKRALMPWLRMLSKCKSPCLEDVFDFEAGKHGWSVQIAVESPTENQLRLARNIDCIRLYRY
jgi:hypothetical protein